VEQDEINSKSERKKTRQIINAHKNTHTLRKNSQIKAVSQGNNLKFIYTQKINI